nr:MAG TPA: hypothetical protein [Caudoviricetes sp.]
MIRYILTALLAIILASCTTSKEITRTITKHDTLRVVQRDTVRQIKLHRDSIIIRDSIYTEGTTLIKERWRERWHIRHDTLRIARVDTIYQAKHSIDKARKIVTRHPWYYGLLIPFLSIAAIIACVAWYLARVYRRLQK